MVNRSTDGSVDAVGEPSRRKRNVYSPPATAHQVVLDGLRGLVVTGELPPGSAIRQDEIAERFGVSRVPVREALKILEGEGHVTYVAHHGFRVTRLSIAELIEIYDMREWIETGLVRASVPRLGRAHLEVVEDAMKLMERAADAGDLATVNRENRRFHFQFFEPSGLRRAMRMVSQLWDATDPYRALYFDRHISAGSVNSDHQKIVDAAFAHDVERTVRLLNLHRSDSVARLRALLKDED
ncbi:GntR family transcriptional regulator [Amycolatopsis taiwanensis]|uniref:GntR family transcriptional regulator n=1 Tax=Amycolatopsis taiwanensis TaxID=342230 RepID=A0A9W6R3E6_9PSEU|nr:GntR family transcriptional regulator [Amycolatopsis taiwanensis]GLY68116.1 GntR family transcriptional regulator [Amycolatopsis taiwanensis]